MELQWPGELILGDIPYGHTEGPKKRYYLCDVSMATSFCGPPPPCSWEVFSSGSAPRHISGLHIPAVCSHFVIYQWD